MDELVKRLREVADEVDNLAEEGTSTAIIGFADGVDRLLTGQSRRRRNEHERTD